MSAFFRNPPDGLQPERLPRLRSPGRGALGRRAAACCAGLLLSPTVVQAAGRVLVIADETEVVADGLSSVGLTLWAAGEDWAWVPDGTVLDVDSTLGTVQGITPTSGGMATATLAAGTWRGLAHVVVGGYDASGDETIGFVAGDTVTTALHLHASFSERTGTMLGHTMEGERSGVDVMWWTDHDLYYYPDPTMECRGMDFENGNLTSFVEFWPPGNFLKGEFELTDSTFLQYTSSVVRGARRSGAFGWRLKGAGAGALGWRTLTYSHAIHPELTTKPLMANVTLSFWVRPGGPPSPAAELWVTVPLSSDTQGNANTLYFYHSGQNYESLNSANERYIRIDAPVGVWTEVSANLTELSEQYFPELGPDQHAQFGEVAIRARGTGNANYDLDDFSWTQSFYGEELRDMQRDYLNSLPYQPKQLVGVEVTPLGDGQHMNAFGSSVPFLPYGDRVEIPLSEAVQLIHDHGGLVSYNHMFGTKEDPVGESERAALVTEQTDMLIASDMYGCDMLEVGYRERTGVLGDFLKVWDAVSQAGIVVTGEGSNDQHFQTNWATMPNNFVTWVDAASDAEPDLLWNLRRGAAWFGDPTYFTDHAVSLTYRDVTSQAEMGQVVAGADGPVDQVFQIDTASAGWEVRLIENGDSTLSVPVTEDGPFSAEWNVDPTGGNVTRVEVYAADGDAVVFSNPIYYWDQADAAAIAPERLPQP